MAATANRAPRRPHDHNPNTANVALVSDHGCLQRLGSVARGVPEDRPDALRGVVHEVSAADHASHRAFAELPSAVGAHVHVGVLRPERALCGQLPDATLPHEPADPRIHLRMQTSDSSDFAF